MPHAGSAPPEISRRQPALPRVRNAARESFQRRLLRQHAIHAVQERLQKTLAKHPVPLVCASQGFSDRAILQSRAPQGPFAKSATGTSSSRTTSALNARNAPSVMAQPFSRAKRAPT